MTRDFLIAWLPAVFFTFAGLLAYKIGDTPAFLGWFVGWFAGGAWAFCLMRRAYR